MAKLTVSLDPIVLERARIRAIRENTTVSAIVGERLERYAAAGTATSGLRPIDAFLELAREGGFGSGPSGRSWTRDEIHDR